MGLVFCRECEFYHPFSESCIRLLFEVITEYARGNVAVVGDHE